MITGIIEAISRTIYAEFGEDYSIYAEEVKQGLKEPCFFITCLKPRRQHQRGERYLCHARFCLQYFPKSHRAAMRECREVAERLFGSLEWLEVGSQTLRGTDMEYELVDSLLHFFVSYDFYAVKAGDRLPSMADLQSKTKLKERGQKYDGRKE